MSRLVHAASAGNWPITFSSAPVPIASGEPGTALAAAGKDTGSTDSEGYAARLAKYIPAEIVAAYLAIDQLFAPTKAAAAAIATSGTITSYIDSHSQPVAIAIFAVLLLATPLYIWSQAEKNQPWGVHAIICTIAFAIWAYSTHGDLLAGDKFYDARVAGVLIALFTLAAGTVVPTASSPSVVAKPAHA
jgi:hypothetical protein